MNENNEVQYLKPFKRFCMSIGELPTSYLETMTYYEMLVWLTKYLGEQVVPTVNNNSEVVEELQNYVANYFDNLDVQDEINNKLDEMAQDGTLASIIVNYATINQFPALKERPTIFVGDSYLYASTNYGDIYKTLVGLPDSSYYRFASNGAGFVATGTGGKTFLQVLQDNISNVTDKTAIKQIIVGSGINDAQYSSTINDMNNAISSFLAYCKTNFPNAMVYICLFGFNVTTSNDGGTKRYNLGKYVHYSYSNYYQYDNYVFIKSSPYWLRDSTFFNDDNLHPNDNGQNRIARRLVSALIKDSSIHDEFTINLNCFQDQSGTGTTVAIPGDRIDNIVSFNGNYVINTNQNLPASISAGWSQTDIGTWSSNKIFPTNTYGLTLNCMIYILSNSVNYNIPGEIILKSDGHVYLRMFAQEFTSFTRIAIVTNVQTFASLYC